MLSVLIMIACLLITNVIDLQPQTFAFSYTIMRNIKTEKKKTCESMTRINITIDRERAYH